MMNFGCSSSASMRVPKHVLVYVAAQMYIKAHTCLITCITCYTCWIPTEATWFATFLPRAVASPLMYLGCSSASYSAAACSALSALCLCSRRPRYSRAKWGISTSLQVKYPPCMQEVVQYSRHRMQTKDADTGYRRGHNDRLSLPHKACSSCLAYCMLA